MMIRLMRKESMMLIGSATDITMTVSIEMLFRLAFYSRSASGQPEGCFRVRSQDCLRLMNAQRRFRIRVKVVGGGLMWMGMRMPLLTVTAGGCHSMLRVVGRLMMMVLLLDSIYGMQGSQVRGILMIQGTAYHMNVHSHR